MQSNDCVIGIDIGGTTTSLGFVDHSGALLCETTIATHANQPAQTLVKRLHDAIGTLQTALPQPITLSGMGIGAPNANYHRGTVESPPNLNWEAVTPLVKLFQQHYDLPIAVTNDANAAALGELLFGGARGMKHAIVITLGTGLGSGFIVNGELLYGCDGFAGELGHTTVDPDGRNCACGKRGCLETYVSAPGICRTVTELLEQRNDSSLLRDMPGEQLTSKRIYQAAGTGDAIALAAFDTTARILAMKLADAVAHTSPEAIFLSGGLSAAGDLLIVPTRHYLETFLFTPYKGKVQLLLSKLPENSGALLGAAALAWHEVRKTTTP